MNMIHYDLFAGIGGFSLALEEVFDDATIKHIFCEWESFPTSVLRQHWPDGEFYGDIADLVTDTKRKGRTGSSDNAKGQHGFTDRSRSNKAQDGFTIVTGGFPCQPFSHAGRRQGTADDRYQWPNMFEVIKNTRPNWVIAENVRGLVTWNDGLVLETVCADLESEGYEVQPLIIPAVAVGAPHRRDRVWIIAHAVNDRPGGTQSEITRPSDSLPEVDRTKHRTAGQSERTDSDRHDSRLDEADPSTDTDSQRERDGLGEVQGKDGEVPERNDHAEPGDTGRQSKESHRHQNAQNPFSKRVERRGESTGQILGGESSEVQDTGPSWPDWNRNWQEVAFSTCDDSMDDGLSRLVDGVSYSRAKWRKDSLKAYGNGICPQVAIEIMKAIKQSI